MSHIGGPEQAERPQVYIMQSIKLGLVQKEGLSTTDMQNCRRASACLGMRLCMRQRMTLRAWTNWAAMTSAFPKGSYGGHAAEQLMRHVKDRGRCR